jgi:hypothetical protein
MSQGIDCRFRASVTQDVVRAGAAKLDSGSGKRMQLAPHLHGAVVAFDQHAVST